MWTIIFMYFMPLGTLAGFTEFATMTYYLTGKSPYTFARYGHYCGIGGNGTPADPIDQCCKTHDGCYNRIDRVDCHGVYGLAVPYLWTKGVTENGTKHAKCSSWNMRGCSSDICSCDSNLTSCFQSRMTFFNQSMVRTGEGLLNIFTSEKTDRESKMNKHGGRFRRWN